MTKIYSPEFERDFNWFLEMRQMFNFDGADTYYKNTVKIFKNRAGETEFNLMNEIPFATFKEQFPAMVEGKAVRKFSFGMFSNYAFIPCSYAIIVPDKNGATGKEAYYQWESAGKIIPTKHPNILAALLKIKGSVNLHIKMYAQDRAQGLFPLIEFRAFCIKYKCPSWFKEAVEKQKYKYYKEYKIF